MNGNRSLHALLLNAALACAAPLCAQPQPAGTIQISLNADIRSTNPGVNRDANTDTVMMHIVEGLVAYREDASTAPLLADTIDISADGTVYTFNLRRNVRFHNGALLTAADVVWAWQRYLDPKTGWNCRPDFDGSRGTKIESVTAADAHAVVFRLNRAQPMLLTQMAALPCGASAIVHRDSLAADGSWIAPIGTGPYRLGEWKRGQYLDLLAFRDYASRGGARDGFTGGKIPYAAKLHWLIIRDDAARRAALIKGQIDILSELAVSEFSAMQQLPHVALNIAPGINANALLIQTRDPLLAKPLLRKALAHSLNTEAIARLASGGASKPNPSMVPSASPYHSTVHERGYRRDLPYARRLLAQSGYRGEPIALITNRRYPDMYDQALMIQSMARDAGINIELQIVEWATQLDRYQSGNYQLMSFSYTARTDPFLSYESMLGDRDKSKRKVWDNPRAIALEEQAGNTADAATRQRLFDQMHELMLEDVPLIMLFNPADVNAVNKSLEGFASWPVGRARLWSVKRLERR